MPGVGSAFRKLAGVSEGRLGVRPPLEGLESPGRKHDSADWWRRAQRGDMLLCFRLTLATGAREGRWEAAGAGLGALLGLSCAEGEEMNSVALPGLRKERSQGELVCQGKKCCSFALYLFSKYLWKSY